MAERWMRPIGLVVLVAALQPWAGPLHAKQDDGGGAGTSAAGEEPAGEAGADQGKEEGSKPAPPPRREEKVVVSASRTEERLLDAPASVTVLDGQDVEQAPARDVPDVLRRVPGVNVVQFTSRDFNLVSRGSSSSLATSQQVLVDGRSIYLDFFGFVMWESLPFGSEELDQVEVVRGPGSAVWGANALTGVVNFRTRSPRELAGLDLVHVEGGEKDSGEVRFLTARAADKVSWKLSGGYRRQLEPWDRPRTAPNGLDLPTYENSAFRNPKIEFRVDRDNDGGGRASMSVGAVRTSGDIHTGIGPFEIDDSTALYHATGSWEKKGTEVQFFVNAMDGEATNVLNFLPFGFKTWTLDLSGRSSRLVHRHRLVWGGNLRYNRFALTIAPDQSRRREAGAFLEDEWLLSDRWSLDTSLRVDWFDTIGSVASPRVGVLFRPDEDNTLRLTWNRAYRSPSLVNNFLRTRIFNSFPLGCDPDYAFPISAVGNPDLDETRLTAIELGYTGKVAKHLLVSAAAYRNQTDDLVDFYPNAYYSRNDPPPGWCAPLVAIPRDFFPKSLTYRNVARVREVGTEIGVQGSWRAWRAWLNWSWQDKPDVSGEPSGDFAINIQPRNRYGVGASWDGRLWGYTVSWDWWGEAFWSDVLDARFWGTTDPIGLLGARVWVKSRKGLLTWTVAGTNLLDDRGPQHPFGDEIGRLVRTGVTFRF